MTIDPAIRRDRWLRRVEIVPGDTRLVLAAFVSVLAPDGRSPAHWVGAWTPWLHTMTFSVPQVFEPVASAR